MSSLPKFAALFLAVAAALSAQPKISGLVNAASYTAAALDSAGNPIGNNNVAQGAIFVIFGSGMGPASLVSNTGLPLTTSLPDANGTSVTVTSGQTVKAFMVYSSAGQVAGI